MMFFVVIIAFIVGIIMGSFGLVLLDRRESIKTALLGRSMCLTCKHTLSSKDLIPLISYISTGGKCRYCAVPIPISCPITELIMWFVFAVTAWLVLLYQWYDLISLISWCMINWSLVLLVIHDHRTQYLHWIAWIVGVVVAWWYIALFRSDILWISLQSSIILAFLFLLLFLFGYMVHWIKYGTRNQWLWFGDVVVALLLGFIAPLVLWYNVLNNFAEFGGIVSVIQLVLWYVVVISTLWLLYWWIRWSSGSQEVEIAFLPSMIVGFWLYMALIYYTPLMRIL